MRWLERGAIAVVVLVILGLPAVAFGYEGFLRSQHENEYTLVGEDGKWSQETIRVKQGEVVRLRLTSDDVVHGFMVEGMDIVVDDVYPGRFTTIEFVADKPGTFAFACTRLCSIAHRKMRGQIVVEAQEQPMASSSPAQR